MNGVNGRGKLSDKKKPAAAKTEGNQTSFRHRKATSRQREGIMMIKKGPSGRKT